MILIEESSEFNVKRVLNLEPIPLGRTPLSRPLGECPPSVRSPEADGKARFRLPAEGRLARAGPPLERPPGIPSGRLAPLARKFLAMSGFALVG